MKLQPPKLIQQSPFDALPRPFDEKIVLFFSPSPNSCRILGHLHPKTPPKIIYPSLHSIESICQGFILWGATGWWRPKIIFSMLTVVFLIVFFSCSFQGLVTIGLLWIVFFLFFSGWEFIWWGAERQPPYKIISFICQRCVFSFFEWNLLFGIWMGRDPPE